MRISDRHGVQVHTARRYVTIQRVCFANKRPHEIVANPPGRVLTRSRMHDKTARIDPSAAYGELCNTPQAVCTHLSERPVSVPILHLNRIAATRCDDDTVGSDPLSSIADRVDQRTRRFHRSHNYHEVVAEALHLDELHSADSSSSHSADHRRSGSLCHTSQRTLGSLRK